MKRCAAFFVYLFLAAIAVSLIPCSISYAHHKKQVLGEATSASELNFPPVTAGPGFLLPDSPFYFLDNALQQVRLLTAFTPQQKTKVRAQIAGERLAELRLMFARNNKNGITTALNSLTRETGLAANSLKDASARGQDVKEVARILNDTIKEQKDVLAVLTIQADGSLKLQLKAAREELKIAKVDVEDELPGDDLQREIEEGLNDEVDEAIDDVEDIAVEIEHDVIELEKQASEAAVRRLKQREDAVRKAISERNDSLVKLRRVEHNTEIKKQDELRKVQKEERDAARESVKEALIAAKKYEAARIKADEINKQSSDTSDSTSTSTSESSSNE